MHMKEGTIIQAIGINDWENQTGGDFTNIPYEDSIIKISIAPPKHFTIQIYENKNSFINLFHSLYLLKTMVWYLWLLNGMKYQGLHLDWRINK